MVVRVVTTKGYDYIDDRYLKMYIEKGYILGLAESIEETVKRFEKKINTILRKEGNKKT